MCISIPERKSESFEECFGDHFRVLQYQKWKWKFQIMFWGSLSIPGRKAPRLHFRWEWIFCNPFTWKMHCDEKPKLALRSETKRIFFVFILLYFCIYFVMFLYFVCYIFAFLFIILSHETCISMRNQSLHCDQKPKGRLFVFQHLTSQGRRNTHSLYKMMI